MEQIALYAAEIVNDSKRGIAFFNDSNKKPKLNYTGTVFHENFGRFFTNEQMLPTNEPQSEALKSGLYDHISNLLDSTDIDKNITCQFKKDMISVVFRKDGKPTGYSKCILCILGISCIEDKGKSKKEEFSIGTKLVGEKCYWISSNFLDHIKCMHGFNVIPSKKVKQPKLKKVKNNKNTPEIESKIESEDETETLDEINDIDRLIQNDSNTSVNTHESDDCHHSNTTIGLDIEPALIGTSDENKMDLQTIFNQISQQLLKVDLLTKSHEIVQNNVVYSCEDESRKLKTIYIPADGNCMYHALVQKMHATDVRSNEHDKLMRQLRYETVLFIDSNFEFFKNELKGRVYEEYSKSKNKNEFNLNDMDGECQKIISSSYIDGYWGGSETLNAIMLKHRVNILIINENGVAYFVDGFNISYDQTLILAYKFREMDENPKKVRCHYESVVWIDPEDIYALSRMILKNINSSNESKRSTDVVNLDMN